jgi:hypothetical protein
MTGKRPARRGYALMLVMIFVILFLATLGVAWRQVKSVLRIETVRATQMRRDQGCLPAVVRAIHFLETTMPGSSPYVWNTTVDGRAFTVTLTQQDPTDLTIWTIEAVPSP